MIVKILEMPKAHRVPILQNSSKTLTAPAPSFDFPAGFFDGAGSNGIGGIGVHILISEEHYFCIKMGGGLSMNTRSELLALWVLLSSHTI